MKKRWTVLIVLAVFVLIFSAAGTPWAAEKKFPSKPIQVIIPFQPGDTDNLLRPFLEKMPEFLGQPGSPRPPDRLPWRRT